MTWKRWFPHVITLLLAALLVLTQQIWAGPVAERLTSAATGSSKTTINYQGYLTDSSGNPVNDPLDMVFRLYNVESGGEALWTETQNVEVQDGLFSVLLGNVTPISTEIIASNNDLWLGIAVGGDEEMSPREKIASAPYAMLANVPDGSITQAKLADNAVTSAKIQDEQVSNSDVGFNYAGSSAKGGPASNVDCSNCISSGEIQNGQVGNADLADNAVNSAKIQDGQVSSSDVGFNYAGSSAKGGAATSIAGYFEGTARSLRIETGAVFFSSIPAGAVVSASITPRGSYSAIKIFGQAQRYDQEGDSKLVISSGSYGLYVWNASQQNVSDVTIDWLLVGY